MTGFGELAWCKDFKVIDSGGTEDYKILRKKNFSIKIISIYIVNKI